MKKLLALLLALCFAVTGCTQSSVTIEKPAFTSSDAWAKEPAARTITAALNFLSLDGNHLMTEIRDVEVQEGQTDEEAVIRALIDGPTDERAMRRVLSSSIKLVNVEKTGRVINVELSANYTYYSELEMLKVRIALANTLCPLFDVDYVNVYVDSADPGYSGMPLGSVKQTALDLSLYCDQIIQEQKNIMDDDDYEEIRTVTFYKPDESGSYLISDPQEMTLETVSSGETVERNYLRSIVFEMLIGSRSALFGGFNLAIEPAVMTDETGKRYAQVVLVEMPENPMVALGALVYTVTGFVCNISYLVVGVQDSSAEQGWSPIQYIEGMGEIDDGKLYRSDFSRIIGEYVTLYLPAADELSLTGVTKAAPQSDSGNAEAILRTLLDAEAAPGTEAFEEYGISAAQLHSVKLCGSVAVVDMAEGFFDACRSLNAQQEFLTIYAIVNTLTEISGVSSVQFLCNGYTLEKLNTIQLSGPLMRNIGVITD